MADPAGGPGWLRARLAAVPERGRADELRRQLAAMIRDILESGEELVLSPDDRMFELGMGSLRLVELKRRLDDAFQVELPVTLFFQHASVGKLNAFLLSDVLGAGAAPEPAAATGPAPAEDHPEEIATLTEEEAEARIGELFAESERDPEP